MRIGDQPDNRLLERGKLTFIYPDGETVLYIPFFENPKITESATANYVEYNPLARAGSMYVYTGAKSRKIKLDLIYTLPHLQNFPMGISRYLSIFSNTSREVMKAQFLQYSNFQKSLPVLTSIESIATSLGKEYYQIRKSMGNPVSKTGFFQTQEQDFIKEMGNVEVIDTLVFFVAMFRSSILNNAVNPIEGPPLVRLNFGSLYQDIPCIVKNYNIGWEEEAGYDVYTLTPNRVKISLELNEVRVGNFGEYQKGVMTSRDNITGWESVIGDAKTIDPGELTN
jgi:hypothetical protein